MDLQRRLRRRGILHVEHQLDEHQRIAFRGVIVYSSVYDLPYLPAARARLGSARADESGD